MPYFNKVKAQYDFRKNKKEKDKGKEYGKKLIIGQSYQTRDANERKR